MESSKIKKSITIDREVDKILRDLAAKIANGNQSLAIEMLIKKGKNKYDFQIEKIEKRLTKLES